ALAAALLADGIDVRVAWGPGEEGLVRAVEEAARRPGLALPPTSIAELAEVLRQARLVAGNDSGTLHLAALVGTPVVGLYGSTDPTTNAPFGPGHACVVAPFPEGGSRRGRLELMLRIGVEEVRAAVLHRLRATLPPPA
ncbi:MAG: glycosyltransferase family 9 protein, partial [Gemmatimonadales bacterium]